MGLFTDLRALALLKRQAEAQERIASALEALLLSQDKSSGQSLRSFYTETNENVEGQVEAPSDEDFAEWEAEERERMRNGRGEGE